MLVLKRNKSMTDKVRHSEQKAIIPGILTVQNQLTVVQEVDSLRNRRKPIGVNRLPLLIHNEGSSFFFVLEVANQMGFHVLQDLEP